MPDKKASVNNMGQEYDALVGRHLGAYSIQAKLGEGGMARVYKGYHTRLQREVAIKVILSHMAGQADFRMRFEREAQLAASLHHPNIVEVYDFGETEQMAYLVMQYVGGGTLRDLLRGGRALEPGRAMMYAAQMGRALHHAHLRGIVHRDVKPQNMLLSSSDPNQLLLSDFGIAKLYDARHESSAFTLISGTGSTLPTDPALTRADQIVGTADYMAPEQVNGEPVDARTDVYALGVVLFQMLTGEVPFRSTTVQGLLFQQVHTPPPPIREFNPYVPEALVQIIDKALAKAPAARFQSAEQMAQALEIANEHATAQFSSSLPQFPTIQRTAPTNPASLAPGQVASQYGPQPAMGAANTGAISGYGTQPAFGTSLAPGQFAGTPQTGISARAPARGTRRGAVGISSAALVVLLALVLVLSRTGVLPFFGGTGNSTPGTTSVAQPFNETFQNDDRHWPVGNINGLMADISNGTYQLAVSGNQTYFPHPDVGVLPDNFTLTATMQQQSGDQSIFYGLAFHLREDGGKVYCYAFVINASGAYQLLKYDAQAPQQETTLWSQSQPLAAIHTGLKQPNTVQAKVHGATFSLQINGQAVPLGTGSTSYTDTSNVYSAGAPALLVAGPNSSFVVTGVKLQMA
jgi:serine/threonine protein kinase